MIIRPFVQNHQKRGDLKMIFSGYHFNKNPKSEKIVTQNNVLNTGKMHKKPKKVGKTRFLNHVIKLSKYHDVNELQQIK